MNCLLKIITHKWGLWANEYALFLLLTCTSIPYLIVLCFIALCRYNVYKLEVCGNPEWSKSISTIFPTAFGHFLSLYCGSLELNHQYLWGRPVLTNCSIKRLNHICYCQWCMSVSVSPELDIIHLSAELIDNKIILIF